MQREELGDSENKSSDANRKVRSTLLASMSTDRYGENMMTINSDFKLSDKPYDAIIVGAGASGLYALHHLRKRGYNAMIIEAAEGVGGTWFWHRYPGLVVDLESVEYSYAFDEQLQQDWNWSRRYSDHAELERYFNHVADRFSLRDSILLNNRVVHTVFDEAANEWVFKTDKGGEYRAPYAIMGTGLVSAPLKNEFEGMDNYQGTSLHTAEWPRNGVDLKGKRVAVIGTGSSGVQVISTIASEVEHLTVFQRTPSFCVPLRNCPMPEDYAQDVKRNYTEWRDHERFNSFGGFISVNYKRLEGIPDSAFEHSPEEREALYEEFYRSGGLCFYNLYPDILTNEKANATLAEFLRRKIRERINDPELERKLVPTTYPVLTRRLVAETNYYEVYKQDNVELHDCREDPIKCFSETGIETDHQSYDFDVIITATGYDALSGALKRMDIRGRNGAPIKEKFMTDSHTSMGMMTAGFPNMFYLNGPGSPASLFQPLLLVQDQMDWILDLLDHTRANGQSVVEPTIELENEWMDHCEEASKATLFHKVSSWYTGGNVKGKSNRGLLYLGGIKGYRGAMEKCKQSGYRGLKFSHASSPCEESVEA